MILILILAPQPLSPGGTCPHLPSPSYDTVCSHSCKCLETIATEEMSYRANSKAKRRAPAYSRMTYDGDAYLAAVQLIRFAAQSDLGVRNIPTQTSSCIIKAL